MPAGGLESAVAGELGDEDDVVAGADVAGQAGVAQDVRYATADYREARREPGRLSARRPVLPPSLRSAPRRATAAR